MNLNFITPKMSAVFGNLEFAGSGAVKSKRNNGTVEIISRTYNLYSDKERTDNVEVTLPPKAGVKLFTPDDRVRLINPRIIASGEKTNNNAHTDYILHADDMVRM